MPGMMTGDQMSELTAATGTDFDKMFLQLMITHHQGAVQMADTKLAQGAKPRRAGPGPVDQDQPNR